MAERDVHCLQFLIFSRLAQTTALYKEGKVVLVPSRQAAEPLLAATETAGVSAPVDVAEEVKPSAAQAAAGVSADVLRVALFLALLLFLLYSNAQWRAANRRIAGLERQLEMLERLLTRRLADR